MVKLTLVNQADDQGGADRGDRRHLRAQAPELRYAIAFEENYSKDWILERYLNIAYFGDGAYGIQAAARHYFDKNAKDLNLRESAMLAGLVKNPTGYDPTNAPDRALERRNVVLDRMAQLNVITREQGRARPRSRTSGSTSAEPTTAASTRAAPFFCDYVVNYLLKDPLARQDPRGAQAAAPLRRPHHPHHHRPAHPGGRRPVGAATTSTRPTRPSAALAMVEPGTGKVKALAQSRPMGRDKKPGETYLNYVVPAGVRRLQRLPGRARRSRCSCWPRRIEQGIPLDDDAQRARAG